MVTKEVGVYRILNKNNGKIYIGSSMDINNRIKSHISKLKSHYHENKKLQLDYNLLGPSFFEFETLQLCLEESLETVEDFYIKLYKSNTYNKHSSSHGRNGKRSDNHQIGIRLDVDLIDKLKKEASRRNRSVTNLIETILKKELDLL